MIGLRPGEKLHEELLIGQGLLTTPHPKILRAAEESLPELEMAHALRELGGHMSTGDVEMMRSLAMQLVRPPKKTRANCGTGDIARRNLAAPLWCWPCRIGLGTA